MKYLKHPVVLVLLGLLLGSGTGIVLLWQRSDKIVAAVTQSRAHAAELVEAQKPAEPWGFWAIELENLATDLRDEKAKLAKREEVLDQREARFAAERQELDKLRRELEAIRREVTEKMGEIKADEAKNLRNLAQTYAALSPKAAVAIFKEMDDVTVVKILSLMKADIVGPIFEEMSKSSDSAANWPKRAAALSERLRVMKSGSSVAATAPGS
ncbi:MAG: hypothetical protein HY302_16410 [Opitutae bacterium]|nr:hypothetical protein [Opitutae bacterium]